MIRSITLHGEIISFATPKVMGILNITPDSFYAGSRLANPRSGTPDIGLIRKKAEDMIAMGADWLDLGGYSSRPGAEDVSEDVEMERLARGLEAIRSVAPGIPVSVDTFRARVAEKCIREYGADIINDISGGDLDSDMWATVAELNVPYILMHTRGTPQNMQALTDYEDVTAEVLRSLAFKTSELRRLGVANVIIDPGFGFAKTTEDNFRLLNHLDVLHQTDAPLLVGLSRKSMIYRTLETSPEEALNGTTALNMVALLNGADILRVHDVSEARECVTLFKMLESQK